LGASQTVNLILSASVREVSLSEGDTTISLTDGRTFSAPWVIDTRPPPRAIGHPWIWQNFVGYVVDFDRDSGVDLDDIPTLMDFQPPEASVAQFVYLLPLSSNSYLCEWTRLSPEHGQLSLIEAKLIQWLRHRAGASWRLVRRESGSLPMALPLAECRERVVSAGTRGGSMRASSGYAFHAIQRWAEACTSSIVATGRPIAPARSRLLESLDASFLSVLQQETASAAGLFGQLFADCEPDALVRFLAGIPRASDFWPVIRSLPWAQFMPTVPLLVSTLCRA
jgi:lycopene beta-cyclase